MKRFVFALSLLVVPCALLLMSCDDDAETAELIDELLAEDEPEVIVAKVTVYWWKNNNLRVSEITQEEYDADPRAYALTPSDLRPAPVPWSAPVAGGPPSPVAKTGLTTSSIAGDDGDLEKGEAWPVPRFTDNGDGTVTDNLTGLVWLQTADDFGIHTWSNALGICNTLNTGESGLTDGSAEGDWRLPNVREILSLPDYGQSGPALPLGHPFSNVSSGTSFWTSTPDGANAITVLMGNGTADYLAKTSSRIVWPVRDAL